LRYHLTYALPGYEAVQVERFASLEEAERRYDELAQNPDVHKLAQPFDTEAPLPDWPSPQVSISLTISSSEQPDDAQPGDDSP
jgi:hypothetical protein